MSPTAVSPAFYADFNRLESLKKSTPQGAPAAVHEAARQFESLFTNMLLKSMREASLGESLGDSEQTQFYQGMFDQQLAVQLSRGKGLGLADRLVQQLQRTGTTTPGLTTLGLAAPASATRNAPSREQFVQNIRPYAVEAARRLGVAPEAVIAHAALETGWGRHVPASVTGSSHNLFGVKSSGHWRGPKALAVTTEYAAGEAVGIRAGFRSYDSIGASMRDYAEVIAANPRFVEALNTGSDIAAFAKGLQRGGYATDPAYVQKLVSTAATVQELAAHSALKNSNTLPISHGGETA